MSTHIEDLRKSKSGGKYNPLLAPFIAYHVVLIVLHHRRKGHFLTLFHRDIVAGIHSGRRIYDLFCDGYRAVVLRKEAPFIGNPEESGVGAQGLVFVIHCRGFEGGPVKGTVAVEIPLIEQYLSVRIVPDTLEMYFFSQQDHLIITRIGSWRFVGVADPERIGQCMIIILAVRGIDRHPDICVPVGGNIFRYLDFLVIPG